MNACPLAKALAAIVLAAGTVLTVPLAADAAPPPAPLVGSCHTYDWATFLAPADTSTPVSCDSAYAARTIFVGRLWTDEPYSTLLTDPKIAVYIVAQCDPARQQAIGPWKTLAVSGYDMASFFPTEAQYNANARWFRCDVVAPGAGHMYPLQHQSPEAVPLTPSYQRCLHATSHGLIATVCAAAHS